MNIRSIYRKKKKKMISYNLQDNKNYIFVFDFLKTFKCHTHEIILCLLLFLAIVNKVNCFNETLFYFYVSNGKSIGSNDKKSYKNFVNCISKFTLYRKSLISAFYITSTSSG